MTNPYKGIISPHFTGQLPDGPILTKEFFDQLIESIRKQYNQGTPMTPTIGRIVHFHPKQECVNSGDTKIETYASIVTQVNPDLTLELATFGPNSLYFQHNVPEHNSDFPATDSHPAGKHTWGWSWPKKE